MKIKLFLLCITLSLHQVIFAQDDKLIFSLDVIRHGDRTPLANFPNSTYDWSEGLGELTAQGMQQEYNLGSKLRKHYIETKKLLPANYKYGTMLAYSTDVDRTLMSAQSFLLGLYPPGTGPKLANKKFALPHGFQPIPVHTSPKLEDRVIPTRDLHVTPDMIKRNLHALPEWQAKEKALKSKFKQWSAETGFKITSLDDLSEVADILTVQKFHNLPFPKGMSKADALEIIDTADWMYVTKFSYKEIADVAGKPIITNILNFFKQSTEKNSALKYVLLSGHDSTLASLSTVLGLKATHRAPYASDLNFSFYEDKTGNYFAVIMFNDVVQTIPECGGTRCSIEQFTKITEK